MELVKEVILSKEDIHHSKEDIHHNKEVIHLSREVTLHNKVVSHPSKEAIHLNREASQANKVETHLSQQTTNLNKVVIHRSKEDSQVREETHHSQDSINHLREEVTTLNLLRKDSRDNGLANNKAHSSLLKVNKGGKVRVVKHHQIKEQVVREVSKDRAGSRVRLAQVASRVEQVSKDKLVRKIKEYRSVHKEVIGHLRTKNLISHRLQVTTQ